MKAHPDFPFIRLERLGDDVPAIDREIGDEWRAIFEEEVAPESFVSEQEAIDGATYELFAERGELVDRYLGQARANKDIELLVRLVDGRARHEARTEARREFAQAVHTVEELLKASKEALFRFRWG